MSAATLAKEQSFFSGYVGCHSSKGYTFFLVVSATTLAKKQSLFLVVSATTILKGHPYFQSGVVALLLKEFQKAATALLKQFSEKQPLSALPLLKG